eukprot:8397719-Karenia_brevis.AAC.1
MLSLNKAFVSEVVKIKKTQDYYFSQELNLKERVAETSKWVWITFRRLAMMIGEEEAETYTI